MSLYDVVLAVGTLSFAVMPEYARPLTATNWPIRFQLELQIVDANSNVLCRDVLNLKVAPLILPPECNAAQAIYSTKLSGITGVSNLNATDALYWAQDMVKFVKYQTATGQTGNLFADLDHFGKGSFPDKLRSSALCNGGMVWTNSMGGEGGSVMATPPFGTNVFGAIMVGDRQGPSYQSKWAGQGIQPVIEIGTSWLMVGHVDEILMWIQTNKVLFADPWKAADLLHGEIAAGHQTNGLWFGFNADGTNRTIQQVVIATNASGAKLATLPAPGLSNSTANATLVFSNASFAVDDILRVDDEILKVVFASGPTVTVARAQASRPCSAHSTGSVIYAFSAVMKSNLPVGGDPAACVVAYIAAASNQLRQALGSYAVDFVPMPVLFDICTNSVGSGIAAGTSDIVNCLVGLGGTIQYPQTGCSVFENYIGSVIAGSQPVNVWTNLHVLNGEIHCATTAQRALDLQTPWWLKINNWE